MSALEFCPDFSSLSKLQSDRFRNDYIRKLGLDSVLQDEAAANANLSRSQRTLIGSEDEEGSSPEYTGDDRQLDGIAEEDEDEDMRAMAKKMSRTTLAADAAAQTAQPSKSKRALAASASRSERPTHQQKRVVATGSVGVTLSDPIKASKERRRVEREAQSALNPGSPISELLKSARKPLYVSPRHNQLASGSNGGFAEGGTQLFQQLISSKENASKQEYQPSSSALPSQPSPVDENIPSNPESLGQSTRAERKAKRTAVPNRIKDENDLGKQKARIASGMMDFAGAGQAQRRHRYAEDEEDNGEEVATQASSKPASQRTSARALSKSVVSTAGSQNQPGQLPRKLHHTVIHKSFLPWPRLIFPKLPL